MDKRSIMYKSPLAYIFILKLIHGADFNRRYQYMASFIKKGDLVLEPACGSALLADFLPKGSFYSGFDTNKDFVKYALKKKRKVYLGDVLDYKNYKKSDVVIACDILHHLKPKQRKIFIQYCFNSFKRKLIICEPGKGNGFFSKILTPWEKWIFEALEKDGINQPRYSESYSKGKLRKEMGSGFSVIPNFIKRKIKAIGRDLIVVYEK